MFLLWLSYAIIQYVAGLTETGETRYALFVDDTMFPKFGGTMELVSKYINHVTMGYESGYWILTLSYADGVTTIPIRY